MNQYPMGGIASLVASQGRNGDSTLVHMNPEEVQALKQFAEANGLPLTFNPQTGYPEAFWLTDFLRNAGRAISSGVQTVGRAIVNNPRPRLS